MAGREPAGGVEVHGARGGGVDESFQYRGHLVRARGVPGEGGQFGGGSRDRGTGLGERAVRLAAQRPPGGPVVGLAEYVDEVRVRGGVGGVDPGADPAARCPGTGR